MPPPLTVEYRLTPDLAARAVTELVAMQRRELARGFRKPFAAFALYTAGCGACLWCGLRLGAEDWFLVAVAAFTAFGAGLVALLVAARVLGLIRLAVGRRRSFRELPSGYSATPDPAVRWTFTPAGFETWIDGEKRRELAWAGVRALRITPGFWFLGLGTGPALLVPRDAIPADVAALIRDRLATLYAKATASAG